MVGDFGAGGTQNLVHQEFVKIKFNLDLFKTNVNVGCMLWLSKAISTEICSICGATVHGALQFGCSKSRLPGLR